MDLGMLYPRDWTPACRSMTSTVLMARWSVDIEIRWAKVYLREAAARRDRQPAFSATLQRALRTRRRAAAIDVNPKLKQG